MTSMTEEEITLPVGFDGSANPDQLTEVTFGTHLEFPDGSKAMVTKQGSGRMSPIRARTMKEYDQQLAELKKENFSLKLRIYFLEERMQQKFDGSGEDLFKTNIELKVEVESLKKELADKQDLLKKASSALESISSQHQVELQQARDNALVDAGSAVHNVEFRLQDLANQLEQRNQALQTTQHELDTAQKQLQQVATVNRQLEMTKQQLQQTVDRQRQNQLNKVLSDEDSDSESSTLKATMAAHQVALDEKNLMIEQLKKALETKELIIEQQEEEHKEALSEINRPLERQIQSLRHEVEKKDKEIQTLLSQLGDGAQTDDGQLNGDVEELVDAYKRRFQDLEETTKHLTHDVEKKDDMIGKLEDIIRSKDKTLKDLESKLSRLQKDKKSHEENALKRDKAIQGLTKALQQKHMEFQSLLHQMESRDQELEEVRNDLKQQAQDKYKDLEDHQTEVAHRDDQISDLQAQLRTKQLENERLQKSIGRKEAEMSRLNQQLEKADEGLRQREDSLQALRDSLQDEKLRNTGKAQSVASHLQVLLDDAQRQIQNKEMLLQRLTRSLAEKDKQLQDYMKMLEEQQPMNESKEGLIHSLRDQIREKDKAVEDVMEDKFKTLEEYDTEIRQLKMSLRERDRDIERANQMLLTTEETIDTMENEAKEREQSMKQMVNALKAQQRAMEEAAESQVGLIEEKEAMIMKLRNSLSNKDKSLQEVIRQSPSASDALMQQLQLRLKEKEDLLQEVMTERSRAAEANQQGAKELLAKLRAKDNEIKEIEENSSGEIAALNREIQHLQAELNKKDYDMQTSENRSTWAEEQQQELLDKLRSALHEKDRTIEMLVESAREKDKLFRQLQDHSPELQESTTGTALAQLQAAKDEIAQLRNNLRNKEDLIERLRMASDRRSPKPDMVPRRHLEDLEDELASRTEALTKALRAEQAAKHQLKSLKKDVADGEASNAEEMQQLRAEIENLKARLDRPGTPQRLQTTIGAEDNAQLAAVVEQQAKEARDLHNALRAERDLYINLNQHVQTPEGEGSASFDIELAAVQALRKQLEEGVERNHRLRGDLEKQILSNDRPPQRDNVDYGSAADLAEQVHSLQNQLEESQRWNASLQTRLQQQPTRTRDGGVGGTSDTRTHVTNGATSTSSTPDYEHDRRDSPGMQSYLPSFYSLPDIDDLVPDELSLRKMSPDELCSLVHKLKDELHNVHSQAEDLQHQLSATEARRDIPGENDQDQLLASQSKSDASVVGNLQRQLDQLQLQLEETRRQKELIQEQYDSMLHSSGSEAAASDSVVVPALKQQLLDMKEQLEASQAEVDATKRRTESSGGKTGSAKLKDLENEVAKLKAQVKHTENLNNLLKRQIELNTKTEQAPSGFNPELIIQMAQEIERLKDELVKAKKKQQRSLEKLVHVAAEQKDSPQSPTRDVNAALQAQAALQKQMEELRTELNDAKVQNKYLEGKLSSTEATVRSQTEKMKYYRAMLEDAGLVAQAASPKRSRSESNLTSVGLELPPKPISRARAASASTENMFSEEALRTRDLSPSSSLPKLNIAQYNDYGHTDNVPELKDQVNNLRGQLGNYSRMVRNLQYKLRQAEDKSKVESTSQKRSGIPTLGGMPLSVSVSTRGSGTKDSTQRLQKEVELLKQKLRASQDSLAQQEAQPEGSRYHAMPPGRDFVKYQRQIIEGLNTCASMQQRVDELYESLDEMLHQDEEGEVDMIDVTPDRVNDFKDQLGELHNLLSYLTVTLESPESTLASSEAIGASRSTIAASSEAIREMGAGNQGEVMADKDKLRSLLQDAHTQIEFLNQQVSEKSNDNDNSELLQELRSRIDQLLSDNSDLVRKAANQQEHLSWLEGENSRLMSLSSKLEQEKTEANERAQEEEEKASRVDKEKASMHQTLKEREDWNTRLRELLKESQQAVQKLNSIIQRLNGEIDDLRAQLLQARQNQTERSQQGQDTQDGPISGLLPRSPYGNDSVASVEHQRHRHPSDNRNGSYRAAGGSPTDCELDGSRENSTLHISRLKSSIASVDLPRHDTGMDSHDFHKYVSHSQASQSTDFETSRRKHPSDPSFDLANQRRPPLPSWEESVERGRTLSSEPHASNLGDLLGTSGPLHSNSAFSTDSIFSASSAGDKAHARQEMELLRSKLRETEEYSRSLKNELKLYENLKTSVGIQNSPTMGSHAIQTGLDDSLTLEQHLVEIQALRRQLEEQIKHNDHLRAELERQLAAAGIAEHSITSDVFSLGGHSFDSMQRELSALKRQLETKDKQLRDMDRLEREMSNLKSQLNARENEARQANQRVQDLDTLVAEKDRINERLLLQTTTMEAELRTAVQEIKRLREEVAELRDQIDENEGLNQTLKHELHMYDNMHIPDESQAPSPAKQTQSQGQALDLSLLLEEIRQLRVQLVKTIENNNALRQRLDEALARSPGHRTFSSRINIHHLQPEAEPSRAGLGRYRNPLTDLSDEAYTDRQEKFTSGTTSNRLSPGPGSSMVNGYAAPSPPTRLGDSPSSAIDGHSPHNGIPPDQMDHIHESDGHPSSSHANSVLGHSSARKQLFSSQRFKPVIDHDSLHSVSSASDGSLHRTDLEISEVRSRTSKDSNMRYSVLDPQRPPGTSDNSHNRPDSAAAMSPSRIGSDLRSLYAIGELDDYELLKKEVSETQSILQGMDARIRERLRIFTRSSPSQSVEYSTLKSLASSVENLRVCLRKQEQLLTLFWVSQLPRRDPSGKFTDMKANQEIQRLQTDLALATTKYNMAKKELKQATDQLNALNKKKEIKGEALLKYMEEHHSILRQARQNLESEKQRYSGTVLGQDI